MLLSFLASRGREKPENLKSNEAGIETMDVIKKMQRIKVMNYMTSFDIVFYNGNEEIMRIRLRAEEFKEIIKKQNVVKVKLEEI